MNFEVNLQNFSKVSKRSRCGGTIYLGITRKAYLIYYGLILLMPGLIYSPITFLHQKEKILSPLKNIKITEWSKFIDYFGTSIEADPSRVGKKNVYFVHIWYITSPSSINIHIPKQHMDKEFNLLSWCLCMYQQTKHIDFRLCHIYLLPQDTYIWVRLFVIF